MSEKMHTCAVRVAPFECVWSEALRFREAGRGCISFEAFAHNDVTVVFREQAASQYYHYKTDKSRNYTVIIGSHRNRRLKVDIDGKTEVDMSCLDLCCPSAFQSYWISIYDGLICIGKDRYCPQNCVFRWLDSNPSLRVQCVGLSSWDKHVSYRNVCILPVRQFSCVPTEIGSIRLTEEIEYREVDGLVKYSGKRLEDFLECWELSDMYFLVGQEEKAIPAHMVILAASGNFHSHLSEGNVIKLPGISYQILHAVLQYIYMGCTWVEKCQLEPVWEVSIFFQVVPLAKQCKEAICNVKLSNKLCASVKAIELAYLSCSVHIPTRFPHAFPLNAEKLHDILSEGVYSDVSVFFDTNCGVVQSHKLVLSLWSLPFMKMFTNGMSESKSAEVCLKDAPLDAFLAMLQFMYTGELNLVDSDQIGSLMLAILILADKFGVTYLCSECCIRLSEYVSEDSACGILQAIAPISSCEALRETCERTFALHFDYCTTNIGCFVHLDEMSFKHILQHPDLTVTSEENVLNAILLWCTETDGKCGWEVIDENLKSVAPIELFGRKFKLLEHLLNFVRFPLMPLSLLQKLERSSICSHFPVLAHFVQEAIEFSEIGHMSVGEHQKLRFQLRRSCFMELHYICDGDENGVIYYAGTSFGQHRWINPVVAKRIILTPSSPISRYTDPKALVSRAYQATCFAGPRIENGQISSWWMVDLGPEHMLMCNFYTLRQDGSNAYMRSWAVQGSIDGKDWKNLRVHENDQTICRPGQFASWPLYCSHALLPFRYFRVVLLGPTANDSSPWNLCICFLELYGSFI